MLSEDAIENLIQPIIDRQEYISNQTIQMIAKRIGEIGTMSPKDVERLKILVMMGADIRKLNKELASLTNLQVRDIKNLIKTVALDSYIDAKPLYDYRHKSFIPFNKNIELKKLVTAIGNVTAKEYLNISNSKATGFLIGNVGDRNNLTFKSIKDTYKIAIDNAIIASKSGIVDYKTAMRKVIKQLTDSGVRRLEWESGYTQRLDTAVRRNLLDGIHAIQQAMEDEIGEQINADGKELSVHKNSALDHEPIQGHIFTNEQWEKLQNNDDFEDVNGKKFSGLDRVIGQWNCRHFAYSIIIGKSKPRYTQKQLDEFIRKNHGGYTLPDGKHLTMYECTQMQRKLETRIRYAKEEQMAYQEANDIIGARKARQKIIRLINEYKIFSKNCGLSAQNDRISVIGYNAIKV